MAACTAVAPAETPIAAIMIRGWNAPLEGRILLETAISMLEDAGWAQSPLAGGIFVYQSVAGHRYALGQYERYPDMVQVSRYPPPEWQRMYVTRDARRAASLLAALLGGQYGPDAYDRLVTKKDDELPLCSTTKPYSRPLAFA